MQVVIITGLSGSGKSTAIHVLEDLGFYCIDNLPVTLIPRFLELSENNKEPIGRVALCIDLRERVSLHEYPSVLDGLRMRGHRGQRGIHAWKIVRPQTGGVRLRSELTRR